MKKEKPNVNELVKCIYSKKYENKSEEHIIPAAFGGEKTIDCVGDQSNNTLSKFEGAMLRKSFLVVERIKRDFKNRYDKPREFLGFNEDYSSTLVIDTSKNITEPGQINITSGILTMNLCNDKECSALIDFMNKAKECISDRKNVELRENKRFDKEQFKIAYSEYDKRYVIYLNDYDDYESLKAILDDLTVDESSLKQVQTREIIENPVIKLLLSWDREDERRFMGKIAFNILSDVTSSDFVLSDCFDDLREYILNGDRSKEINASVEYGKRKNIIHMKRKGEGLVKILIAAKLDPTKIIPVDDNFKNELFSYKEKINNLLEDNHNSRATITAIEMSEDDFLRKIKDLSIEEEILNSLKGTDKKTDVDAVIIFIGDDKKSLECYLSIAGNLYHIIYSSTFDIDLARFSDIRFPIIKSLDEYR
ncbi:MAG: HNH endonuclease [Fusobacteriaceae bacterium]|jgi:hypothetical protein|nr:HNH endonuclease [Fusobacteriaceae bacterium]